MRKVVFLLMFLGCHAPAPLTVHDVAGHLSESVPTVLLVSFESDAVGVPAVRFGYGDTLDRITPDGPQGDTWAELPILGLKAGKTVRWQPVVTLPDGSVLEGAIRSRAVPAAPTMLRNLQMSRHDPTQAQPGPFFVLTQVLNGTTSYVVIVDRDGDVVWYVASRNPTVNIVHTELSADGTAVLWAEFDRPVNIDPNNFSGAGGVYRMALDGKTEQFTLLPDAHHDFAELDDGRLAYLAYDIRDVEIDDLAPGPYPVQSTAVRSVLQGATDGTYDTLFALIDDYPAPPWYVCSHLEPTENAFGLFQWDHTNSLMRDPVSGDLVMLMRNFDSLLWLDANTGEITRHLGGVHGQPFASGAFDHGHMSHLWDTGFMVFDNGLHSERPSAMVAYNLDRETDVATEVWRYDQPGSIRMPVLSDVDKMPGGNYLGTWTKLGRITEVTPAGEVVWQLESANGAAIARATPLLDLYDLNPSSPPGQR